MVVMKSIKVELIQFVRANNYKIVAILLDTKGPEIRTHNMKMISLNLNVVTKLLLA